MSNAMQAGVDAAVVITGKIHKSLDRRSVETRRPVPRLVAPFPGGNRPEVTREDRRLAPPKPDDTHIDPRRLRAAEAADLVTFHHATPTSPRPTKGEREALILTRGRAAGEFTRLDACGWLPSVPRMTVELTVSHLFTTGHLERTRRGVYTVPAVRISSRL